MSFLRVLFISGILVITIFIVEAQQRNTRVGARKQMICKKCQNSLKELQNEEPKIDDLELLDNLLTICDAGSNHPALENQNKCNSMAEFVYMMSNYPNLCTLVGICDDARDNSVLPFTFNPKNPYCDISMCGGLASDCGHKCACTKECTPECTKCFENTATICDVCIKSQ